ncbi:hypothetical protein BC826DRAFT_1048347 [Russula brevipes]|nr:hypothetical protein BC826DRAFT_1048347 [Russula brevipes]
MIRNNNTMMKSALWVIPPMTLGRPLFGVILRNIQVNGSRAENILMGDPNVDQLIEYGPGLLCNSVIIQNDEFGPSGTPGFDEDADAVFPQSAALTHL